MGTRSLTVFLGEDGNEIAVMYRQFDGYPEGHGQALKEWAGDKVLVNGLGGGDNEVWNMMGCCAASCVAEFKDGPGSFYLYPAGTRDCGEEYIYILYTDWNPFDGSAERYGHLKVRVIDTYGEKVDGKAVLYDGLMSEFDPSAFVEKKAR